MQHSHQHEGDDDAAALGSSERQMIAKYGPKPAKSQVLLFFLRAQLSRTDGACCVLKEQNSIRYHVCAQQGLSHHAAQ